MCLCSLQEEATATLPKVRSKGGIKESAVTKDQDKKGPKSQRGKRRTPLPVASTSDCSESTQQDQHQETLDLKRNQRQGKTHQHTQQGYIMGFFALLLFY